MPADQSTPHVVPDAAAHDRSLKARRRLSRSLLPMLVAGIALCLAVVWQRDTRHIEAARQRIIRQMAPVAEYLEANGTLPNDFPRARPESENGAVFTYVEPDVVRWAMGADRPVIIGYGRGEGLIARPDGHGVMIFEQGALRDAWLSRGQLHDHLAEQKGLAGIRGGP